MLEALDRRIREARRDSAHMRIATARADSSVLESEVRQVVGPLLEALAADNVTLSCDEFCTLLEGEIQHRRDGPEPHG